MRTSLGALPALREALASIDSPLLQELHGHSDDHAEVAHLLTAAIAEEPSTFVRDGDVIATDYDADLDELRRICTNSDEFMLELESRERDRSGIPGLRLGYNRVQGFFIEIVAQGRRARTEGLSAPSDGEERRTLHHA